MPPAAGNVHSTLLALLVACTTVAALCHAHTTPQALDSLPCRRRVLLSGTPLQNHLDEFYAMVDFCNPGVLGTPAQFRWVHLSQGRDRQRGHQIYHCPGTPPAARGPAQRPRRMEL